jgi:hypothetical protein
VLWPDPADEATLKAIAAPANSACCAGVSLLRALAVRNGGESHANCSMLEVDPLADVPTANLPCVCKRLQPGRKPTDAENSAHDGERNYASSKFVIWGDPSAVRFDVTRLMGRRRSGAYLPGARATRAMDDAAVPTARLSAP